MNNCDNRWITSTQKTQVLTSMRVFVTQVVTRYTVFYFRLLEYSQVIETSFTRSE